MQLPSGTGGDLLVRATDTSSAVGDFMDSLAVESIVIFSEITSSCGVTPIANFSANPTEGDAPLLVSFTDTSSGVPTSWSWNFGDGETSSTQNPTHTYDEAGTYTVSLTATAECGADMVGYTDFITVNQSTSGIVVHVNRQSVERLARGPNQFSRDTVIVVDQHDSPVAGATVTAQYIGPTSGNVSGVTDSNGVVQLDSAKTKENLELSWCFTIDAIAVSGGDWDGVVPPPVCDNGLTP